MIMRFLRENVVAAGLFVLVRVYLGWQWMNAGWHKITGETAFDATGFLNGAMGKPVLDKATNELVYPTYMAFIEHLALPNAKIINVLIPWGEFLVGAGLILGAFTTVAAFFALMMNFMFMFAGTVSTNPWFILVGMFILVAGANAGKFGLDYYIVPYLRHLIVMDKKDKGNKNKMLGGHTPTLQH